MAPNTTLIGLGIQMIEDHLPVATLTKLPSTMSNLGSMNLSEFTANAILTLVSEQSIVEGGTSNIVQIESESDAMCQA